MPFNSAAQERLMWAKHPKIARKWERKYGSLLHAMKKMKHKKKKKN